MLVYEPLVVHTYYQVQAQTASTQEQDPGEEYNWFGDMYCFTTLMYSITSRLRTRPVIILRATADFLHQKARTQSHPVKSAGKSQYLQIS